MPVKNLKKTKASKFQGQRAGWVFKLGEQGLGYYVDSRPRHTVHLYPLIVPAGGASPIELELDSLVPSLPTCMPPPVGNLQHSVGSVAVHSSHSVDPHLPAVLDDDTDALVDKFLGRSSSAMRPAENGTSLSSEHRASTKWSCAGQGQWGRSEPTSPPSSHSNLRSSTHTSSEHLERRMSREAEQHLRIAPQSEAALSVSIASVSYALQALQVVNLSIALKRAPAMMQA